MSDAASIPAGGNLLSFEAQARLKRRREHLPGDALEQAVRSYIKAGGRKLDDVVIFENTETRVR